MQSASRDQHSADATSMRRRRLKRCGRPRAGATGVTIIESLAEPWSLAPSGPTLGLFYFPISEWPALDTLHKPLRAPKRHIDAASAGGATRDGTLICRCGSWRRWCFRRDEEALGWMQSLQSLNHTRPHYHEPACCEQPTHHVTASHPSPERIEGPTGAHHPGATTSVVGRGHFNIDTSLAVALIGLDWLAGCASTHGVLALTPACYE